MIKEDFDITGWLRRGLNIMFVGHPQRTSMGLFAGVVCDALVTIFSPTLASIKMVDFTKIKIWQYMLSGVFFFHVFPQLFQSNTLDEETERELRMLKRIREEGKLTRSESRELYLKYIRERAERRQKPTST